MKNKNVNKMYAKMVINAIVTLASDKKKLENLERYLSDNFDPWCELYANNPRGLAIELEEFSKVEVK